MKITSHDVVPDSTDDDDAIIRPCAECEQNSFHVPQKRMVFGPGGARSMRLWACETHPLPRMITDQPDEEN